MPKIPIKSCDEKLNWLIHKKRWKTCSKCSLCKNRSKPALLRGTIPCDILFIGPYPGEAEDTLGKPMVGPAGRLLEEIIQESLIASGQALSMAFTYLLACRMPEMEYSPKQEEEFLKSCQPRLEEVSKLADPKAIVMLGKLSQKWSPVLVDLDPEYSIDLIHPYSLFSLDKSQQALMIQRVTQKLTNFFTKVGNKDA